MRFKKIMILTIILVTLLAVSSVNAAENATEDIISTDNVIEDMELVGITETNVIGTEDNSSLLSGNDYGNGESSFVPVDEIGNPIKNNDNAIGLNNGDSNPNANNDNEKTYSSISMTSSFKTTYGGETPYYLVCEWEGYFNGYFKVYKGSSCIFNKHVKGYDKEYLWDQPFDWNVGTYKAYIYDIYGEKILYQKYVINKELTKISIKKSWNVKPGKEIHIYGKVLEHDGDRVYGNLKVTLKVNGKTYKCQLNDGYIDVWIKAPKKSKTYTAKITALGTKNYIGSSKNFKLVVKGSTSKKKTSSKYKIITVTSKYREVVKKSGKFTVSVWKWNGGSFGGLDIILYKNGKELPRSKYYSRGYTNFGGYWHWATWSQASSGYEMKHHYPKDNNVKITYVQVKVHV